LCARKKNPSAREATPQEENLVDLAVQDRRISSKVSTPALIQAIATLTLAAVEGPRDGATLGMALATILTATVGWLKSDCRYVALRHEFAPARSTATEGLTDVPD
jgi:hypothetical protein